MKPLSRKTSTFITTTICRLALIIACLVILFPIYWIVTASFGKSASLFSTSLIPTTVTLVNFKNLLVNTDFIIWMKNSAIACFGGSLLSLFFTITMAYAFSRFKFSGRRYGLLALILIQMLPATATIVAIYQVLQHLQLINKLVGLILVYGGFSIPFNAWLMRGYFDSIPRDLDESAYIDGANEWQTFIKIALPLAMPMVVVVFIFNIISFFNDYLLVSIVMSGNEHYTVALGMRFFTQAYAANWSMFAAGAILACIPIMIIFYALQKYLVQGLVNGAIKG
jgi:arabinogalactan oligomer/maltooligosaccharide transport system permease protein